MKKQRNIKKLNSKIRIRYFMNGKYYWSLETSCKKGKKLGIDGAFEGLLKLTRKKAINDFVDFYLDNKELFRVINPEIPKCIQEEINKYEK